MKFFQVVLSAAILSQATAASPADNKKPLTAGEVFKRSIPAIVAIDCYAMPGPMKRSTASGFVVSSDGKIVTSLHVIQFCSNAVVRMSDGKSFNSVNVADFDARKDLAVIRIPATSLPKLDLADSNKLEVGQTVYSIGNPSGLQNTLQPGMISGFREFGGVRLVQVSASINPGNSGGPILDDHARVIGVADLKVTAAENLGFAIPIDYAKGIIEAQTNIPFAQFAAAMPKPMPKLPPAPTILPPPPPKASGQPPRTGALNFTRIEAFAGRPWKFDVEGLPALKAGLGRLHGVAVDRAGNIYLSDVGNQAIVKIDSKGMTHVLTGPDSPAESRPVTPQQIAVDASGDVYFAEDGQRVRKILPSGEVITLAGSSKRGFTADGSPANGAQLSGVTGVAVAADGSVLFSEWDNQRVRRIDANGMLQTIAGNGQGGFSGDNGPGAQALLQHPMGLAVDSGGNVFIADNGNGRVRKVSPDGVITTVAGGGVTRDNLCRPAAVAVDGRGALYIADYCRRQVLVVRNGESSVLGGNNSKAPEPSGVDGPATAAGFDEWGLAVNAEGDVLVAGPDTGYLYRIASDGILRIMAGAGNWRAPADGTPAAEAFFQHPSHLAVDPSGALLVTDYEANRIYRIEKGTVTHVAGQPRPFFSGENVTAKDAGLDQPIGVAVRPSGDILFTERGGSNRVRDILSDGRLRTVAGNGRRDYSGDGGPATRASLQLPLGLCADAAGNIYVADTANHRVRKIDANGNIQLVAGKGAAGFSGDGGPAERAELNTPVAVTLGPDGSLYIADAANHRVRRVSKEGVISTLAGDGVARTAGDGGMAARASFGWPYALAFGPDQALYVLDSQQLRVRRIDAASGLVTTVAGNGRNTVSGDGGSPLQAGLGRLEGMAFDTAGNLYLGEGGGVIRVVRSTTGPAPTILMPNYGDPLGKLGAPAGAAAGAPNGDAADSLPQVVYKREAQYSAEGLAKKFEGVVYVSLVVDATGMPTDVKVVTPVGMGLDEKAVEAVSAWRFKPAYKNGQPVAMPAKVEVRFNLLPGK